MKKSLLLNALLVLFSATLFAQAPQKICYQAAAKDATGADLASSPISIRASIIQGSPNGLPEWVEVHQNILTDAFGLFTIDIGTGSFSGGSQTNFSDIDWGNGTYWLKIEMDALGGQNFINMGTTQMISVPYALYANATARAENADNADNADFAQNAGNAETANMADTAMVAMEVLGDNDLDDTNELQTLFYDNANGELSILAPDGTPVGDPLPIQISGGQDEDSTNELQTIEFSNGFLTLVNPDGSIMTSVQVLPNAVGTIDTSFTNELQTLGTQNGELVLLNPDGTVNGDGVVFDDSPTNELQTLGVINDTLFLINPDGTPATPPNGGGGGISFPEDADGDPENELQEVSYNAGNLTISGGNTISLIEADDISGPGTSSDFPQGFLGEHILLTEGLYTVPEDKVFWITAGDSNVKLNNVGPPPFVIHPTTPNMPVLEGGTVVENCMCTGVLADTVSTIEPIIIDFILDDAGTYTVPSGKVLFIKSGLKNDQPGRINVNGMDMTFLSPSFTRGTRIMSFPGGTNLQAIPNPFGEIDLILTGYLLNRDAIIGDPTGD